MASFTVLGRPQPQGSKRLLRQRYTGKPVLAEDNRRMKPWRQEVGWTALEHFRGKRIERPAGVAVEVTFYLAPPKRGRIHPTAKPDVDKLCRAVLDALTGIAFDDDSQVVALTAVKTYGLPERAEIRVAAV